MLGAMHDSGGSILDGTERAPRKYLGPGHQPERRGWWPGRYPNYYEPA
jgi:hypothetical protein